VFEVCERDTIGYNKIRDGTMRGAREMVRITGAGSCRDFCLHLVISGREVAGSSIVCCIHLL
jgi:hypothetical protein